MHQACNDWFTVDELPAQVFSITNAKFTLNEMDYFLAHKKQMGMMFNVFVPHFVEMVFKKRKRVINKKI